MRSRGVAGLVVAALALVVGLIVFKAQQAHDDRTVERATVSAPLTLCDDAHLRAAVDDSGHYDTTPFRLDAVRCADSYGSATVTLTSVDAEDDTALFHYDGTRWELVDAGTDLGTAEENGVPTEVWDQLFH